MTEQGETLTIQVVMQSVEQRRRAGDGEQTRGISENSMSDLYDCRSGSITPVLYPREWILQIR